MQLEEQGLLDLSDPVEKYIDFELPDNFIEPIRIIDLMNCPPGFEDNLIGLMVMDEKYHIFLQQAGMKDIPRRIMPPGRSSSYSNYGTMLVGSTFRYLSALRSC